MTHDGPPTRHLHPVEPPFDPDYDHRGPSHDPAAERALLALLVTEPDTAPHLADQLQPDDFYRPEHETIWDTWHQLAQTDGVPPDAVTLNHHLIQTKQAAAVRALADITEVALRGDAHAIHADRYIRIIRDNARIRAAQAAHQALGRELAKLNPDNLETQFHDVVQTIVDAATRFDTGTPTGTNAGLKDLSWLLGGQPPVIPPPVYVRRDDGTALFYKGKVNGVFGDPEGGKTWLAQLAIVEALNAGETAAMIDVDHNGPDHTAARLILLGARMEHLANPDRFRYYEPEDGEELTAAVHELITWAPDVLVIDSLGEIFPMLGVNTNDTDEMTSAMRLVCSRPAIAGACVITVDHLPKSADARSTGYAIGSIAKKRMIRGAYLRVEAKVKPMPGGTGKIALRIEKDTSGELRRSSHGGYAGTLVLDSTNPQATTWNITRLEAPQNDDGTFRPTNYMEQVATFIADHPECSSRDIELGIPGTAKHIRHALQILVTEGHVARNRRTGRGGGIAHTLVIPYREAEDDHAQQSI